jgi:hypothetical protein
VLDDAKRESPTVTITVVGSVPMSQPFMGELEVAILRDLFPLPKQGGGRVVHQEGGGFLLFCYH